MNEVQAMKRSIADRLSGYYDAREADTLARLLLQEAGGMSYPRLVLDGGKFTENHRVLLEEWTERLLSHEPIQQILGYADFGNLRLRVTPDTLIPRPETEELCHIIIERGFLKPGDRVLDLGTGTGAIALFLKSAVPEAEVHALEASPNALAVAEANALSLGLEVTFHEMDMLHYRDLGPFDLLVSNPPYILPSERKQMDPHVLDFEPDTALFVPQDDPALFYRVIVEKVTPFLKPGGHIALELNPLTADYVRALYEEAGIGNISLEEDLFGKKRFLFAEKMP